MIEHEKSVQALKELNEQRRARPGVSLMKLVDLVDGAARRHDLDAAQSEWLLRMALAPAPDGAPVSPR